MRTSWHCREGLGINIDPGNPAWGLNLAASFSLKKQGATRWLYESLPSLKLFGSVFLRGVVLADGETLEIHTPVIETLEIHTSSINEAGGDESLPCQRKSSLTSFTKPVHSQHRSVDRTRFHAPGESGEDTRETPCSILQPLVRDSHQALQLGCKWPGSVPAKSVRFMMFPGVDRET